MRRLLFLVLIFWTVRSIGQDVRFEFVTPSIVRVRISADSSFGDNGTGVCVYPKPVVSFKYWETPNRKVYTSSEMRISYNRLTNEMVFSGRHGDKVLINYTNVHTEPVYQERVTYDENSAHIEETANGKVTVRNAVSRDTIGKSTRYIANFKALRGSTFYGLGCQMEGYMNLSGKTVWLTQHNLKVQIPMLITPDGYGLLFDAGCAMKFSSKTDGSFTMQLEAAKTLEYYFIKGDSMDEIVGGYRYLTGKVSMMPRYVFGYTQSKERYVSSEDLISTLKEYRKRHIPIDMIVQDWNYWPQGWGYMKMDPKHYPDPKALADSIHAMNAKLMVSIWPNPQWCPEADDFKGKGYMLEHDVYDVFNPDARKLYWNYADNEFFSKGFDAWWCDSSEPLDGDWNQTPEPINGKPYSWDDQERRWNLNKQVLSEALGQERSSLYSLYHSKGIYENQRAEQSGKRVVNLTRSSFAGQQRFGTIVWNGDTHASWQSFRDQIPAGLNYMATGNPYWTVDVGSFFTNDDHRRWFYKGEFPEGVKSDSYKEYYVRMFQWATFLPMLRSHGSDTPREIWQFGESGTQYYDAILKMINLRYAHLPYIYSMAAMQSDGSYSMARMLAFNYSDDHNVLDIKDEYMFGNYLVCPVTHPMSETNIRRVYLPKGDNWISYWDGKEYVGGVWLDIDVETDKLPLFVKCGSIIPTTEVAEYSDAQNGKPLTINIYPGKDCDFTLYEDEGDNYNFERGESSEIPLHWDNGSRTITIGDRAGNYDGMPATRTITVRLHKKDETKTLIYNGKKTSIKF